MKTIEEAARGYAIKVLNFKPGEKYSDWSHCIDSVSKDFIAGVEFAQEWTGTDEELPDYFEEVIIKIEFEKLGGGSRYVGYDIGMLDDKGWSSPKIESHHKNNIPVKNTYAVTHWRQITKKQDGVFHEQ